MNVLYSGVYSYTYNNCKPGNYSWARAYTLNYPRTDLQLCTHCGLRKTPKRMWPGTGLCISCNNKYRSVQKKVYKYINSFDKKDCGSGFPRAIRLLWYMFNALDSMQNTWNYACDEILIKSGCHLSLPDVKAIARGMKSSNLFVLCDRGIGQKMYPLSVMRMDCRYSLKWEQ